MDQSHRVLDYAPRVRRGSPALWNALVYLVAVYAFFMAGAVCGRLVAHLFVRPQYMADGWIFVSPTNPKRFPAIALPPAKELEIVTEALNAARTSRAGGSLRDSAAVALGKSEFTPCTSPRAVHIVYTDTDRQAVDSMMPSLLSAYTHVQAAAWNLTPRTAFAGSTQSLARPVQTRRLDNYSSLAGSCLGVLVYVFWTRRRKVRPNSTVQAG
jgi:hypothetical protein